MKYIKEYNCWVEIDNPQKEDNTYYVHDDPRHPSELPPGVKEGKPISISNKYVDYIKKGLGIDTKFDFVKLVNRSRILRFMGDDAYTRYHFYYNSKTGEVGNLNTMNSAPKKHTREVTVTSYTDEWFKVMIDDMVYWCDQVEGVVQCVKDSINKDVYYNYINESVEYFYHITPSEFDSLLIPRKALKFTDKENVWLDKLDKWGDYSFNIDDVTKCITFMMVDGKFNGMNLNFWPRVIEGEIYKVSDEWYLVELKLDVLSVPMYYKCDQIDGLVDFLKKLKKKVPDSTLTINDI